MIEKIHGCSMSVISIASKSGLLVSMALNIHYYFPYNSIPLKVKIVGNWYAVTSVADIGNTFVEASHIEMKYALAGFYDDIYKKYIMVGSVTNAI